MKNSLAFIVSLLFFACNKTEIPVPDITSGLVASIPLDGTAFEEMSSSYGIIVNALPTSNRHGEANKAMLFNSNDSSLIDFGDIEDLSFTNNQFTVSCWVMVSDTVAPVSILSKRGETGPWEFSLDNHFNHRVFNFDNWVADGSTTVYGIDPLKSAAVVRPGIWSHIGFVADGVAIKVYQDGILQAGTDSINTGLFLNNTDAHFFIGNGGGYGKNYFFNGGIDDVRIYNRPLNQESIQYLALQ